MFVNVSSDSVNLYETLSSLRFAAKVHEIQVAKPRKRSKINLTDSLMSPVAQQSCSTPMLDPADLDEAARILEFAAESDSHTE